MFYKEKKRFSLRKNKAYGVCSVFLGAFVIGMTADNFALASEDVNSVSEKPVFNEVQKDNSNTDKQTNNDTVSNNLEIKEVVVNEKIEELTKAIVRDSLTLEKNENIDPYQLIENLSDIEVSNVEWVDGFPTSKDLNKKILVTYNNGSTDTFSVKIINKIKTDDTNDLKVIEDKKTESSIINSNVAFRAVRPATTGVRSTSATPRTGSRAASENTDKEYLNENKDYKNINFLSFSPKDISSSSVNTKKNIDFTLSTLFGLTVSGKDKKINIQLDEAIAKHVTTITIPNIDNGGPVNFTRKSNALGKLTNIWEAPLLKPAGGVFVGGNIGVVRTAGTGTIGLNTTVGNIKKIAQAAGDKLNYRVYVSEGNDIIKQSESNGYIIDEKLITENPETGKNISELFAQGNGIANYNHGVGNKGSVEVSLVHPKDHLWNYNLSGPLGVLASSKQWSYNLRIDPDLVPYVSRVELNKVDWVVNRGAEIDNARSKRNVATLTLADFNKEGYAKVTRTDLNEVVEFNNGTTEPIVTSYNVILNKNLNEILKSTTKRDFIFNGFFTDKDGRRIKNSVATASYAINDIDKDGTADDIEINTAPPTDPLVGAPTISGPLYDVDKSVSGNVNINAQAGNVVIEGLGKSLTLTEKGDSVNFTINDVTLTKGQRVTVTSKGSKIGKQESNALVVLESPVAKDISDVQKGSNIPTASAELLKNKESMPEGTLYEWIEEPNFTQEGRTQGKLKVTMPGVVNGVDYGGRVFELDVPYNVIDTNELEAEVTPPNTLTEGQPIPEGTKVVTPNKPGSTITTGDLPEGTTGISVDKDGNLVGTPDITNWTGDDEETREVKVPVTITNGDETVEVEVPVTIQRDTDGDGIPDVTDEDDDNDGILDKDDTTPKVADNLNGKVTPPTTLTEGQPVPEGTKVVTPNKPGSTITTGDLPEGTTGISVDKDGNLVGTPDITNWTGDDEETREVKVPVTITNGDESVKVEIPVTIQRDTDGDGIPDVTDEDDDNDGILDKDDNRPKLFDKVVEIKEDDESKKDNKVIEIKKEKINNDYKQKKLSNTGERQSNAGLAGIGLITLALALLRRKTNK